MAQQLDTDEWAARLGEALRELRLHHNLGQRELAERAGVARSAVQNLEAGRANLTTLVRVVRALGRDDWLAALGNAPTINPLTMTRRGQRKRASRASHGEP